jgi:hypothetical protein
MSKDQLNKSESEDILDTIVTSPYKYGFTTNLETEEFEKGLNLDIVRKISKKKDEPEFLLKFREKAFKSWEKMNSPTWAYLITPEIDYNGIQYYSVPKTKKKLGSLDDADPELLRTFEKLRQGWLLQGAGGRAAPGHRAPGALGGEGRPRLRDQRQQERRPVFQHPRPHP